MTTFIDTQATLRRNIVQDGIAHVTTHQQLRLTVLPTNVQPNNAGPYYFLVTEHAAALTAFRTLWGLMRWAAERGLTIDYSAIPDTRDDVIVLDIVGAYKDARWTATREQFEPMRGHRTLKLDNAQYTTAVITWDRDDLLHVVNFMNVNTDRSVHDYRRAQSMIDGDATVVPSSMSVTRALAAALLPDRNGWHMVIDGMSGSWLWEKAGVRAQLYATPWFDFEPVLPITLTNHEGDIMQFDLDLLDDELDPIDESLLKGSTAFSWQPDADVVAVRYLHLIDPVLQYLDKHGELLVSTRADRIAEREERERYDEVLSEQIALGLARELAEDPRAVERAFTRVSHRTLRIHGAQSFLDAGVMTSDVGFVLDTLVDGQRRKVHVTIQVQ